MITCHVWACLGMALTGLPWHTKSMPDVCLNSPSGGTRPVNRLVVHAFAKALPGCSGPSTWQGPWRPVWHATPRQGARHSCLRQGNSLPAQPLTHKTALTGSSNVWWPVWPSVVLALAAPHAPGAKAQHHGGLDGPWCAKQPVKGSVGHCLGLAVVFP